ncbi:MAG TPA: hypothetical protein VFL83_12415 [Anaeromyxobacter sp.]|nr:hypothetical protein [Anaeromyxobacter sp.]
MASFAKITRPVLSCVLERGRLLRRLEDALASHPIAWIGAPAGSGKTVLAESLAQARGGPCLWFQLDARDADPTSFFFYLRAAAGRLVPRKRETLPVLTPAYALTLEAYARDFFEQLGARLRPGTLVVLDDYQEIPEDAPLQRLLPRALASLPDTIRVVVASRAAPPAPFARLLAHGRIATLGEADLDLTEDETLALARLQDGPELCARGAAALRTRTGGWFAGTILLLARGGAFPRDAGAEASAHEVLFDYFAAEILDRAPPAIRRFLLETAVLPDVSVAAAVQLTGEERSPEILADLVRRNYFTVRRAGEEPTYQYHPLFRAFLLARARTALPRERWQELVRRAIEALEREGAVEDAAALMIEAGDHQGLARLAIEQAPAIAREGRLSTLLTWLRVLPAEVRHANPWLSLWLGVCRSQADRSEARSHLERAYEQFKAVDDPVGQYVAWSAIVRTFLVVWDRFDPLDRWIAEFEELRRRHPGFPSVEVEAGVTRAITAALMWRQSGHLDMEGWAARCASLLRADLAPETKMEVAMAVSCYLHWVKGDRAAHARILADTRPLLAAPGVPPIVTLLWHLNEASYRGRLGDRDACFAAVERCLATIADAGLEPYRLTVALHAIYGALAAGDLAGARRYHEASRAWLRCDYVTGPAYHDFMGIWISLIEGALGRAAEQVRDWRERADACGVEFARPWADSTAAHVLIEQGRPLEAVAELAATLEWSRARRNPVVEHHCALSIAYALLSAGREGDAVEALREAMALGREHGYVTHPWIGWRHDVMARLCALALEHGIEVEHVRAQIRASRLQPPTSPPDAWPFPIRIQTLGAFEVWRGEERLATDGRANRKPLELLQALVALGGSDVREEALAEALWPDADGDAAHHALETNLYRLRKLIGAEAVLQRGRRLSLDPRICWADAVSLQRSAARIAGWGDGAAPGTAPRAAEGPGDGVLARETARTANLYRGPFLAASGDDLPWVMAERQRLRRAVERAVAALGRSGGAGPSHAAALGARFAEVDPGAERGSLHVVGAPAGSGRTTVSRRA